MSTITTINGTDIQSVSRATINDNFTNLNTDKADKVVGLQQFASTTSAQLDGVISDSIGEGSLLFGNALDFYKYSIVTSVASGNLTVALKNFEGNDPTASKPVKIQIGDTVRTLSRALSYVANSGINYFNLGSAELATKEADIFVYLRWDTGSNQIELDVSRYPNATVSGDFVQNNFNEKGYGVSAFAGSPTTDKEQNIGRFNATLSAGAGYTWSIPATSVIINSPTYETRWLESANYRYIVQGNNLITQRDFAFTMASGTEYLSVGVTLPMTYSTYSINFGGVDSAAFGTPSETVMIHWNAKTTNSFNFVAITRAGNVPVDRTSTALIQTTGKW